jgi:hypothetical protein
VRAVWHVEELNDGTRTLAVESLSPTMGGPVSLQLFWHLETQRAIHSVIVQQAHLWPMRLFQCKALKYHKCFRNAWDMARKRILDNANRCSAETSRFERCA